MNSLVLTIVLTLGGSVANAAPLMLSCDIFDQATGKYDPSNGNSSFSITISDDQKTAEFKTVPIYGAGSEGTPVIAVLTQSADEDAKNVYTAKAAQVNDAVVFIRSPKGKAGILQTKDDYFFCEI